MAGHRLCTGKRPNFEIIGWCRSRRSHRPSSSMRP
jgi:hypothetical protein